MKLSPTIRGASGADISAVLALWGLARSAHAATTDHRGDVRRLLAEQPGSLLVAETESAIVGVLIAAWDGWRGNLYRLAVHPEHRRRGIATALSKPARITSAYSAPGASAPSSGATMKLPAPATCGGAPIGHDAGPRGLVTRGPSGTP